MTDKKKKKAAKKSAAKKDPRAEINVLAIIAALEDHILTDKKMDPLQVSAALALLKKILPDVTDAKKSPADMQASHETAILDLE